MSVEYVEYATNIDIHLSENISWFDSDTDCTVIISQPDTDADLWNRYLDAAQQSYRRHGVESVVDASAIRDGHDTALFWSVLDRRGQLVGGVRAKGPLLGADDSHAVVEWAGQPGLAAVRKTIDDRAPFGIVEMKTAWVSDDRNRAHAVTDLLARTGFHVTTLLDVQFIMATAAQHVLELWKSGGGAVAAIPATPYPDERYRTKMMWWDRRTLTSLAEQAQISKAMREVRHISSFLIST
jgi:hypothetical protein